MRQELPSRERTLYQQLQRNYETRQYKKGLKAADAILKKHPDHGETQAMKALIWNSQGNKDDAFALAKDALKADMKSPVCWHVYGILYRDAKNFEEAQKAFKFALKIEAESPIIQRDLAQLQIHLRDYVGHVQSRRTILRDRPAYRMNWTALAVAQHLSGDLQGAERTLTAYEDSLRTPPEKKDTEHQQAILYKNMIIAESGQTEKALEHLNVVSENVFDNQLILELRARYLLDLNRSSEAEEVFQKLIQRNQENRAYYEGLQVAKGIENSDTDVLEFFYAEFSKRYPKSDAPRRIPLDFLTGNEFRKAADDYLKRMLAKGVPSSFNNVKALYSDRSKQDTIQDLVEGYHQNPPPMSNGDAGKGKHGSKHFDTAVLYFLAQHYNFHMSRDLMKALQYIDKAIEKDNKSVDYPMTKARILKHRGSVQKAAEMMDFARSLDERDRYINTKASKYRLRSNDNEKALTLMGKFTKQDAAGGPLGDLVDMQSVWFLTESGESYFRQGKLGLALKRFVSIYNIFDLWQEDQYDFHAYSLRKGSIRAYIDMVRWEDHLRDHPFYTRASIAATKAYLSLHDKPDAGRGLLPYGVNGEHTSASEKKKMARKVKKERERQAQAEAEKKDAKKTANSTEMETKKEDKDPEGKQLLETENPLKDSLKFLLPMLESSPKNLEAQKVGFEVFLRRKKYLLALRCLLATKSIAPDSPTYHSQLLRLQHALESLSSPLPSKVSEVFDVDFKPLLPTPNPDIKSLNNDYLSKNTTAQAVFAGAEVRRAVDPSSDEKIKDDFGKVLRNDLTSLEEAQQGLDMLKYWDLPIGEYITAAHERWPEADAFAAGA